MEATELRLSNYITDKSGNIIQVESISKEGVMVFINEMWIEDLKPIELTEQWLIDFKFSMTTFHDGVLIWRKEPLEFWTQNELWLNKIYDEDIVIKKTPMVKFVHQLQNLFFALTGKELTKQEFPYSNKE